MNGKRKWNIGKLTERKTKQILKNNGFVVFKTDVDASGIDILAFKNVNNIPTIFIIEVKGTENKNLKWTERFTKKQYNKYKLFQKKLEEQGFVVKFQLWFWKFINNKWEYEIIDLTKLDFR